MEKIWIIPDLLLKIKSYLSTAPADNHFLCIIIGTRINLDMFKMY